MTPRVVLIGPPGAGKSTVGRHLAALLGVPLRDTDEDVEATAGKPVAEIFVDDGEPEFRRLEREAVARALTGFDGVLALGGGAVLDEASQGALAGYRAAGGTVVFLAVSVTHAAPRGSVHVHRDIEAYAHLVHGFTLPPLLRCALYPPSRRIRSKRCVMDAPLLSFKKNCASDVSRALRP